MKKFRIKGAVSHRALQIDSGRGDKPNVYVDSIITAEPLKNTLLDQPEEPRLCCMGKAADLIKKAMVDLGHSLRARGLKTRLISQIHDELLLETPDSEQEEALDLVRRTMSEAMSLLVPLDVDARVAKNWAGAH